MHVCVCVYVCACVCLCVYEKERKRERERERERERVTYKKMKVDCHDDIHIHIHIHTHTYTGRGHSQSATARGSSQTKSTCCFLVQHTYIHTYTYTYIHTYIHTHIHTHIHTQAEVARKQLLRAQVVKQNADAEKDLTTYMQNVSTQIRVIIQGMSTFFCAYACIMVLFFGKCAYNICRTLAHRFASLFKVCLLVFVRMHVSWCVVFW